MQRQSVLLDCIQCQREQPHLATYLGNVIASFSGSKCATAFRTPPMALFRGQKAGDLGKELVSAVLRAIQVDVVRGVGQLADVVYRPLRPATRVVHLAAAHRRDNHNPAAVNFLAVTRKLIDRAG